MAREKEQLVISLCFNCKLVRTVPSANGKEGFHNRWADVCSVPTATAVLVALCSARDALCPRCGHISLPLAYSNAWSVSLIVAVEVLTGP